MQGTELATILGWVLLWALVIGAFTLFLLRLLRRASVLAQICLAVVGTVAVLAVGMVSAFNAMVISARDLEIIWYILAMASVVAVVLSLMLGVGVWECLAYWWRPRGGLDGVKRWKQGMARSALLRP